MILDSLDSPRPGLGGSHHLPPYSILYVAPPRPRSSDSLSRDSQSGVPKLSQFGTLRTLGHHNFSPQPPIGTRSKPIFYLSSRAFQRYVALPHRTSGSDRFLTFCGRESNCQFDFGLSFAHNLGCRCPNDSCEAILDIYTSRPFQWYQEHFNARFFDACNQALNFRESQRTPNPQLWECEFHPHTWPKWGCDINKEWNLIITKFNVI